MQEYIMAKVKPYIITVKYIGFYEDPRPTVDQILNEINMDAIEITIEDAMVTPVPKIVDTPPAIRVSPPSRPVATPAETAEVDTKNLEKGGASEKILKLLAKSGPRTLNQIRELTSLRGPVPQVTLSRLKKQGRVTVVSKDANGHSVYKFVR